MCVTIGGGWLGDESCGVEPLDPRGRLHIPIGLADALDSLKTFVEAEGNFSPGFATYGIYFWLYDPASGKLFAPTQEGVRCEHGLRGRGYLIPWSAWEAAEIRVESEIAQVQRASSLGNVQVIAARLLLTNRAATDRRVGLYVALRPLGAAGGAVGQLSVSGDRRALLVDGHPAVVAAERPDGSGVCATDAVGTLAQAGKLPADATATSARGDCSGALRYDVALAPRATRTLRFVYPVLAGRRAVAHDWDRTSPWAQADLARPHPPTGGTLQPDPGLDFSRSLDCDELFQQAHAYWKDLSGRVAVHVPDPRWAECFAAIIGHAAVELNAGAPDVSVVNYNVFNRDGVYVANILQKARQPELAAAAIDYFLGHPFNGRVKCEADNPGQVLWIMGQHWLFTRDREWLTRVYPAAAKLAAMIRYYRTTPGPHFVQATSLEFGDALPPDSANAKPADRRQVLEPGSCDGFHPEYTEAFDIAGLRAAEILAQASGQTAAAADWQQLANRLLAQYGHRFGERLPKEYGSYCVLWPCRLYPLDDGPARTQFQKVGKQQPTGWRYFPLATAHQGLLVGNRGAGWGTIAAHLEHEQMRGWYAFDEGGRSGSGGWPFARTTWPASTAMPHGWAISELWLLLRDCLVFEADERLVLLGGVAPDWFTAPEGLAVENLPTHFGACTFRYKVTGNSARLLLDGPAAPPRGYVLRLPPQFDVQVTVAGQVLPRNTDGDVAFPAETRVIDLQATQ